MILEFVKTLYKNVFLLKDPIRIEVKITTAIVEYTAQEIGKYITLMISTNMKNGGNLFRYLSKKVLF